MFKFTHVAIIIVIMSLSHVLPLLSILAADTCKFQVYWNVPSNACHKYGMNFSEVSNIGIVQNTNDAFRGDKIVILYDPGQFPALTDVVKNGGVPQEGNLTAHLEYFKIDVEAAIPDSNFSGLAVIDFERWRPIWRQNWGTMDEYRQYSRDIEKQRHPFWSNEKIERTAISRFEKAAYTFMQQTIITAKTVRPNALWGYYIFPLCFNFTPKNPSKNCPEDVKKENDRSGWMFEDSMALYPSIYLNEKNVPSDKRTRLISGRVQEAVRISDKIAPTPIPVIPYTSFRYQDTRSFLTKWDMLNSLKVTKDNGACGAIIWGSSKDTKTQKSCLQIVKYINDVLDPVMKILN